MKTTLIIILIVFCSFAFGQKSKPVSQKQLDKIDGEMTKQYSSPQLTFITSYFMTFEKSDWLDTTVYIKKYKGEYYSNAPYWVKIDTLNHFIKLYKYSHMIFMTGFGVTYSPIHNKSI